MRVFFAASCFLVSRDLHKRWLIILLLSQDSTRFNFLFAILCIIFLSIVTLNVLLIMLQHKLNERHQADSPAMEKKRNVFEKGFLKLFCWAAFLLTKSIKSGWNGSRNRYWSDFYYGHHTCVCAWNENKSHNLASLTNLIMDNKELLLQFARCFYLEKTCWQSPWTWPTTKLFSKKPHSLLNPPDIVCHGWGSLIKFCFFESEFGFCRKQNEAIFSSFSPRHQAVLMDIAHRKYFFYCYDQRQIKC